MKLRKKQVKYLPNHLDIEFREPDNCALGKWTENLTIDPEIPKIIKLSWSFDNQRYMFNHDLQILNYEITTDEFILRGRINYFRLYSDEYSHESMHDCYIRKNNGQKVQLSWDRERTIHYSENEWDEKEIEIV